MNNKAIILHPKDNVATAIAELSKGEVFSTGETRVEIGEDIAFGHKFALINLPVDAVVLKYGEAIGLAGTNISKGMHVHVHNVESQRGRGDQGENK